MDMCPTISKKPTPNLDNLPRQDSIDPTFSGFGPKPKFTIVRISKWVLGSKSTQTKCFPSSSCRPCSTCSKLSNTHLRSQFRAIVEKL